MVFFRRSLLLVLGILLIVFVVACGGTPNTGMNSSSARAASTMTTQTYIIQTGNQANSNQNNQEDSQVPVARSKTLISTRQVNVNGHMVTVLTTFKGMTLYERTSDPAPGSNCTGPCAHVWPPLLSKGTVKSMASIGGKLTVYLTANGKQVEYNGHPLYIYSGDMAPGQTNGQGVGSVWQVVNASFQQRHW